MRRKHCDLTVEELAVWTGTKYGGDVIGFSDGNFKTVSSFIRNSASPTSDPADELGAFRCGPYLVVGKRWFRDDVCKAWEFSE